MKKILKNKVYNTETAKKIAEHNNEVLFEKRTGEVFLYNVKEDAIKPLNFDEADAWCKQNMHQSFDSLTGSSDVRMLITFDHETYAKLKHLAGDKKQYTSTNAIVNDLIKKALK